MDFVKGLVVRSAAGRDKGGFFTVLETDAQYAIICDGKRRSLIHPKKKKTKHLFVTNTVLPEGSMQTNREIRCALKSFNAESRFPQEEANICQNRT